MSRAVTLTVLLVIVLLGAGAAAFASVLPQVSPGAGGSLGDDPRLSTPSQEQQADAVSSEQPPPTVPVQTAEVEVLPERCGDIAVDALKVQRAVKGFVSTNASSLPVRDVARSLVVVACVYPGSTEGAVDAIVVFPQPVTLTAMPSDCRPPADVSPVPGVFIPAGPNCRPQPMIEQSAPAVPIQLQLDEIR